MAKIAMINAKTRQLIGKAAGSEAQRYMRKCVRMTAHNRRTLTEWSKSDSIGP
jgi:hypothetical protein